MEEELKQLKVYCVPGNLLVYLDRKQDGDGEEWKQAKGAETGSKATAWKRNLNILNSITSTKNLLGFFNYRQDLTNEMCNRAGEVKK